MVDVSIKSLISMARDYVERANIDTDNSESINTDTELNRLLAGTGASSIEELVGSDIHKKVVERDTEKVFTTFMTTENEEQAQKNYELMQVCMKQISETYDKLNKGFQTNEKLMSRICMCLEELEFELDKGKIGQDAVNELYGKLEETSVLVESHLKELFEIESDYSNLTGKKFTPLQRLKNRVEEMLSILKMQIHTIQNSSVSMEQAQEEVKMSIVQVKTALQEAYELRMQYEQQKKEDVKLMAYIKDYQHVFLFEGKYDKKEKQERSKEFLEKLIDKTSPMTRNYVIKQAEMAYNPENDPTVTGIKQNDAAPQIKRSSYQTPKEIYKLSGSNVFVYDRQGRVLRTEALDPSVHKKFFE